MAYTKSALPVYHEPEPKSAYFVHIAMGCPTSSYPMASWRPLWGTPLYAVLVALVALVPSRSAEGFRFGLRTYCATLRQCEKLIRSKSSFFFLLEGISRRSWVDRLAYDHWDIENGTMFDIGNHQIGFSPLPY